MFLNISYIFLTHIKRGIANHQYSSKSVLSNMSLSAAAAANDDDDDPANDDDDDDPANDDDNADTPPCSGFAIYLSK